MTVEIQKGGTTAKDNDGNIYKIKGLSLKRNDGRGDDIYYDKSTTFFKTACPSGTKHKAVLLDKNLINIL